jgi:hypothetical protein
MEKQKLDTLVKTEVVALLAALILSATFSAQPTHQSRKTRDTFPVPDSNPKMLFYLQRSLDINTIVYEANYMNDGTLFEEMPVNIYWIDYEHKARRSSLTKAQRKYAYGIKGKLQGPEKAHYLINIVSYKKVNIFLKPGEKDKKYAAYVIINGKPAILKRIFINIIGGTPISPKIAFIQLEGIDLRTSASVREQFVPKD